MNVKRFLWLLWLLRSPVLAGAVIVDGTLGPAGALTGPNYANTPDKGIQVGNNLFHSFTRFDLSQNDIATFSGSNATRNVISRVTGGSPSSIDGKIRSTMPSADVWFVNPAGIRFGATATLDVQGSLPRHDRRLPDLG